MLRELETVSGEGKVYCHGEYMYPVRYRITVLQRMHTIKTYGSAPSQIPGLMDIKGRIAADKAALLHMVEQAEPPFTLHLQDGRRLDFLVVNSEGRILNASDRGLYSEG